MSLNIQDIQKLKMATSGHLSQPLSVEDAKASFSKTNDSASPEVPTPPKKNLGDYAAEEQMAGGQHIVDAVMRGADKYKSNEGHPFKQTLNLLEAALGSASGAAQVFFAPLTATVKDLSDKASNNRTVQAFANTPAVSSSLDAVNSAIAPIQHLAEKNPDAARNISDAINVILSAVGEKITPLDNMNITDAISNIKGDMVSAGSSLAEHAGKLKTKIVGTPEEIAQRALEQKAQDTAQLQDMAGRVVQGTPEDAKLAADVLPKMDTTNINTRLDLFSAIGAKVKNMSEWLDSQLRPEGQSVVYKPIDELSFTTKVGGKDVSHNYVQDSINMLKEHYAATNDVEGLTKINQLEARANSEGLDIKDINDLAKEQGSTIESFKKNGDLASTNKAQTAENIRSGLKDTARQIFNNPIYEATDKHLSALIRTKELIGKLIVDANKISQKTIEAKWGAKAGALALKVADYLSGGLIKGIAREAIGKAQTTTLNALELEKELPKLLDNIRSISEATTEKQAISGLSKIIKETSVKKVTKPSVKNKKK